MLKFIEKVTVRSSPSVRSARTFLDSLYPDKNRAQNPKCVISVNISDSIETPSIEVIYKDKKSIKLDPSSMSAAEILKDINQHSRKLQMMEDINAS
ncbi:hypothetical protein SeMB42_g02097 [Synchytrium endobioticum]|uniref:Large ribosomal subunit protein mL53 n=1 Tax=Synchytrium endobioticum TaxID=286115 RepID=A0A507DIY6_9FUNG|nr:hypothetical protein SeLEV6574_g02583 [Synchytrium endobioticum]TPX50868.1 hypothetical protein SeMB42_g02097 [Synchytrium endobioticum]